MRKRFFLILLLFGFATLGKSQNSYNLRLVLTTIDTATAIACYDVQIANAGDEPWDLANYNVSLFYDAAAACYRSDSLVTDGNLYMADVRSDILGAGMISGSGLPFEDSLGFLRLGLSFVDGGIGATMDTSGAWLSTINICFDIKLSDITSPQTCLQINTNSAQLQSALGVFPDIMQEWTSINSTTDVTRSSALGITPNANRTSCFVLAENTEALCTDGLDNDEDGLMDCMDDDCTPGDDLSILPGIIDCFNPLGSIEITGGTGNLMYSLDDGASFSSDSLSRDLSPGLYDIIVAKNNIMACAFTNTIVIQAPDCSETDDIACMDNIDNDGDGLIDCEDDSCLPRIDSISTIQPIVCPLLNDGSIEVYSVFPSIAYSIDSGLTFQADPLFMDLEEGSYHVFIQNMNTACAVAYDQNPIIVMALDTCIIPDEICSDGLDNDFDGLIDCMDTDCLGQMVCLNIPELVMPNIINPNSPQNARFTIQAPGGLDVTSLSVYDRYGSLIYRDIDYDDTDLMSGWDGTQNGQIVSGGVYIYHATLSVDGTLIERAGDITVIY